MDSKAGTKTTKVFNLGSALFAFCLWGGWAYYVNHSQGVYTGLISGLAQGTASFIITLGMVYAITWLYARIPASPIRLLLPAIITVSCTATGLYAVHSLVGTPNIAYTIAPALSVAFMFCVYTSYKLSRVSNKNKIHNQRDHR